MGQECVKGIISWFREKKQKRDTWEVPLGPSKNPFFSHKKSKQQNSLGKITEPVLPSIL